MSGRALFSSNVRAAPEQKQEGQGAVDDSEAFIRRMTHDAQRNRGRSEPESFTAEDAEAAQAARANVERTVSHTMDTATPSQAEVDVYNAQVVPTTARERKRMLAEEVLRFRRKIEEIQEQVEHLQVSNRGLMNKVMSAQADNDDARLQLAKAEASQETAEQALADAKIELDRVSKDATAAENEVSRLQAEVKATKAEVAAEEAAMEREEGDLAQQLARMEAEAKEREDAINADIAAAHATLEAARAEAVELDSRLAGHTAVAEEAQRLRAALIEGKAWHLHKSLVKTIKDSKSEQVRLQNILVHSQEQRAEAMTTLEGARSQRDKLKAQLSAALAAASSAENAVASARRDMAYQAIESGSTRPALTDGAASPPGGARRSPGGGSTGNADEDARGMNSEMAELRAMLSDLKTTMAQEMSTLDAQAKAAQQLAQRASSRERQ